LIGKHTDDHQLLPRFRAKWKREREHSVAVERAVSAAEAENREVEVPARVPRGTLPGDARKLRGIPAISRFGMGGAIPGTRPG